MNPFSEKNFRMPLTSILSPASGARRTRMRF
jgi:hypothetical protein